MTRRSAVLFDVGDTLLTLRPAKEEIVAQFLAGKGSSIPAIQIRQAYRIVDFCHKQSAVRLRSPREKTKFLEDLNAALFRALGLAREADSWAAQLHAAFQEKRRWTTFDEVPAVLDRLRRMGYTLGVLSNWDSGLEGVLADQGILDFFQVVCSSAALGVEKPDPRAFLAILDRMGLEASAALYVGNEYEVDVVGARTAALEPVLIDRDGFWPWADCLRFRDLTAFADHLPVLAVHGRTVGGG